MSDLTLVRECRLVGRTPICHAICVSVDNETYCKAQQGSNTPMDIAAYGMMIALAFVMIAVSVMFIIFVRDSFKG